MINILALKWMVNLCIFVLFLKEKWSSMTSGNRPAAPDSQPRILIIFVNAIGDFILFTSMLEGLRQKYQDHKVTLVGYERWKDLAIPNPTFDNFIFFDRENLLHRPRELYRLIRNLRSEKYKTVLYPSYSRTPLGDMLVYACQAEQKIGFDGDTNNISPSLKQRNNRLYTRLIHGSDAEVQELERYHHFARELGAEVSHALPTISLPTGYEARAREILETYGCNLGQAYAVFSPGSAQSIKYWHMEGYQSVVEYLSERGLKVVGCGGPQDARLLDDIESHTTAGIINLAGKTSLLELAAICKNAEIFVGVDTGPLHIGVAMGIPTVGIMGGGHPYRFYPYGDPQRNVAVYLEMECFGCNWKCIQPYVRCIKDISSAAVIKNIDSLLLPAAAQGMV